MRAAVEQGTLSRDRKPWPSQLSVTSIEVDDSLIMIAET
jgi:hypothetical protein